MENCFSCYHLFAIGVNHYRVVRRCEIDGVYWDFRLTVKEVRLANVNPLDPVRGSFPGILRTVLGFGIWCSVASLHAVDPPPSIVTHPRSQSVSLGADVLFRVIASSTTAVTYQWQFNQTALPGATNSTMVVTNVQVPQAGDYTVNVANQFGSTTSRGATLTVDPTFTKITRGPVVNDRGDSTGAAWGDYDNDGDLDLFVSNFGSPFNFLYRNDGADSFTRITSGEIATDLFVPNNNENNFLYHNNRDGTFTKITSGPVVTDGGSSFGAAWGDYDNDGHLDLFVANLNQRNFLYHNNGDGTFTRMTSGEIVTDVGYSWGAAWADYDNDGFLDLFVANGPPNGPGQNDFLYHNNRDGTFTKITTGSLVNDAAIGDGCAWGDYNNDGFLDLFVTNLNNQNNLLYRNNGNSHNWLIVQCAGRSSNRAGIGAKVRIKAAIAGQPRWQLREISGGSGYASQNALYAHFGLGDATNIALVRIEWPSGMTQELKDVAPRQFLILKEPARLDSAARMTNGHFTLTVHGGKGFSYAIESSIDLVSWTRLSLSANSQAPITISVPPSIGAQFYRAVEE